MKKFTLSAPLAAFGPLRFKLTFRPPASFPIPSQDAISKFFLGPALFNKRHSGPHRPLTDYLFSFHHHLIGLTSPPGGHKPAQPRQDRFIQKNYSQDQNKGNTNNRFFFNSTLLFHGFRNPTMQQNYASIKIFGPGAERILQYCLPHTEQLK
jgi:hypothetical protein